MKKRNIVRDLPATTSLRVRAEAEVSAAQVAPLGDHALRCLVHELQVHQIELEMQNEELRHARAEVVDGLDRYTELYDFAPVCYVTLTSEATILQINLAGASLLGLERAQLVNGRFGFFVSEATRSAFNAFLGHVVASQTRESCQVDLLTDDKGLRHAQLTARAVRPSDGPVVVLLAVEDITERQCREAELTQTIGLLDASQRAAGLGWCVLDIRSGRWTSSAILDEILGIDANFDRTSEGWLTLTHPEDRDGAVAYRQRVIEDRSHFDRVYRIIRKSDGAIRWVWAQGTLELDTQGDPVHMVCTVQDMTKQELLQEARRVAEQANESKDLFLATLSHELRTPLASILMRAALLQRDAMTVAKAKLAGESIERAALMQSRLIEDLLDVSRIAAGKLRLVELPVDVAAIIRVAVEEVRGVAEAGHVGLRMYIETPVKVLGDAARLQQVLGNLLNNALKFTPAGGRVTVTLVVVADHAEIRVTDTGKGITPAFIPHLFRRFSQADSSGTRQQGGLGLGLAIVHDLVVAHHGTVRAESPGLDQGATFMVRLPILRATSPQDHDGFAMLLPGAAGSARLPVDEPPS